jgi:hypothetical protein
MCSHLRRHRDNQPASETGLFTLRSPDSIGTEGGSARPRGVVLLVTLVVLLVLAVLGYNLTSRVAAQRHRDNYIIDYTNACYARDSAIKYALATLQDLKSVELVSRPNEPDFSDLFTLSESNYRRLLEQWAAELAKKQSELPGDANGQPNSGTQNFEGFGKDGNVKGLLDINSLDINGANDVNRKYAAEPNTEPNSLNTEPNSLNSVEIRGPYGPPWPYVTEPVEFQIGSATVKIKIEDENAKYPVGWAVLGDENVQREADAGLETFCEWMGFDAARIDSLKEQLKQVVSIKSFKVTFEQTTQRTPVTTTTTDTRPRRAGTRPRRTTTTYKTVTVPPTEQLTKQTRDFSELFHSSLIDTEMLAAPTIEGRDESALKYMSLWGTTQVNINSAPRQVLEAAFTFGGDADRIAAEVIKQRREKPFTDIEELKKQLFSFSGEIEKCKPYITTASSVFAIRVTASSGVAKASAVIVVFKEGSKIERIAVVGG